jgi:hypothetical protein
LSVRLIPVWALACALLAGCGASTTTASSRTLGSAADAPRAVRHSCHARGHGRFSLPDRRCTPGAIDLRVSQRTIDSTICRRGYSESVRPPESVTEPEKLASMKAYGDLGPPREYEYDHLIPLELGGAPNDSRNLWPEPGASPNPKDLLENRLRSMVCDGAIELRTAQREIAADWITLYRRLIG